MTAVDDPDEPGSAQYACAVRFRLDASTSEWRADTRTIERTCYWEAAPPGEPGWLFFRDHLCAGSAITPSTSRVSSRRPSPFPSKMSNFAACAPTKHTSPR
jgi:hypothetical protein